jgi:hypothetical protein
MQTPPPAPPPPPPGPQALWDALALPARWRYRHVPGPPFRLLVGNLPEFVEHGSHEFWRRCAQQYGPVFKVGVRA